MQLSGWWMFLSFYQSVLAFPLAIVALVLLVRARSTRGRAACAGLLALVLLPHIQLHAGNYYFDYLCRTQAGEFIYRTVDNVEGILQMRPRDGSKDYFDRMRAGDIPEDPWGHTNWEAQSPATMFVNPPWSRYKFFETVKPTAAEKFQGERGKAIKQREEVGARYRRYYGYNQAAKQPMLVDFVREPKSVFGYLWQESSSTIQRLLNIHRGEIKVLRLSSNEELARAIGFYRVRPASICPPGKDDKLVYRFVSQVLQPASDTSAR